MQISTLYIVTIIWETMQYKLFIVSYRTIYISRSNNNNINKIIIIIIEEEKMLFHFILCNKKKTVFEYFQTKINYIYSVQIILFFFLYRMYMYLLHKSTIVIYLI